MENISVIPKFGTKTVWKDGNFLPWEEANTNDVTHSLHYGGAVFEGIRFYETSDGPKIFRAKEHFERLHYSAGVLSFEVPYSVQELIEIACELVKKSGEQAGYIRPIAYRGGENMKVIPEGASVHVSMSVWKWKKYLEHPTIQIKIPKTRRIHPSTTDVRAKIAGHYANGIIVGHEVLKAGYAEALLLDTDGYIAEGTGENIFFIQGNKLITPSLGNILPGITRSTIMEIIRDNFSYEIEERKIRPEELSSFDEAFFTGTAAEVTPISMIEDEGGNKCEYKSSEKESIANAIRDFYLETVAGKKEQYSSWLF